MATPTGDSYSATHGAIYGGRYSVPPFDNVTITGSDANAPTSTNGLICVVELHGSGGQNTTTGRRYVADCSGSMAYSTYNQFLFSTVKSTNPNIFLLRPVDQYGTYANATRRESMWLGFKNIPDATIHLITQRRLEALMMWADSAFSTSVARKRCLTGGSMGGWGTLTFGVRRPHIFAAIYPDRPRWRYDATIGEVAVADWNSFLTSVPVGSAPNLSAEDGGGSVFAKIHDVISYVSNTANKIPWIGWNVGSNDGFVQFQDHIDAVAAMRAAKRGFAFAWNTGNHTTGSIPTQITQSYPYGTFEIGKGYPLFTEHSLDNDPAVDPVGGINIGLSFRNVVESAAGWSCEVTNILNPCTVKVEPISDKFTASVTPQQVTIPAANTWVPVSFSA